MIRYFEAFAGLGAFRSAFEKVGGFECVGWCSYVKKKAKLNRRKLTSVSDFFAKRIKV